MNLIFEYNPNHQDVDNRVKMIVTGLFGTFEFGTSVGSWNEYWGGKSLSVGSHRLSEEDKETVERLELLVILNSFPLEYRERALETNFNILNYLNEASSKGNTLIVDDVIEYFVATFVHSQAGDDFENENIIKENISLMTRLLTRPL